MPFWKPKKKKKAVHKAKPAKSLPKYEPKPFIPPEIPKIDISANQQKEPQKPAPKKASSSRADDKKYFIETFNKLVSERNRPWDIWKDFVLMTACAFSNAVDNIFSYRSSASPDSSRSAILLPIRNGDSLENYWFTPMYFSDVWHTRRVVSQMMDILREEHESDDH